jgi:hypothetical protein
MLLKSGNGATPPAAVSRVPAQFPAAAGGSNWKPLSELAWLDSGIPQSLLQVGRLQASEFVNSSPRTGPDQGQDRLPEGVDWRHNRIDDVVLEGLAANFQRNSYGRHLHGVLEQR